MGVARCRPHSCVTFSSPTLLLQRFRTVVADVSETTLSYWGYLGGAASEETPAPASASSRGSHDDLPVLPRLGSWSSLASSAGGDGGSAGGGDEELQLQAGHGGERRPWYAWRRPWPASVDPPGAF